ncbi:MAG: hypothetical protein FJX72_03260 [Armatimonadetes bacterium]|nr:hypothetical protein [Armatimonadota bacterium]
MKNQVNPLVALVLICAALAAVWYVYTNVFSGKESGSTGPPAGVSMPAPPASKRPAGPPGSPEWKAEQAAKAKAGNKADDTGSGTTSPSPK